MRITLSNAIKRINYAGNCYTDAIYANGSTCIKLATCLHITLIHTFCLMFKRAIGMY